MGLYANPNDPCPVGPVFAPPTGLSFRHMDAAPFGKPTSQECTSLGSNLWQKNSGSFFTNLFAENQIYHTFTGLLDYNIQAVTY